MKSTELDKLVEYYKEDKLSHAYLITTNNIDKCFEALINVVKSIFCDDEFSLNCNKCSLCHLIDLNNLPSLKIISPDGNFIKKEQIQELKYFFAKESQFTKESIYIIKNCEKMNKESANTMLKFLEEPTGNVIGFFLTYHLDNVMPTIQSRCEHLSIQFENDSYEKYNISKEKYSEYMDVINNYLKALEIENKELILINKKYFSNYEKEDIKKILQLILNIYREELVLRYKNIKKFSYLEKNTLNNLQRKINLLIRVLQELNYNVNLDLLLDSFVLEMDAINNENI